VDGIVTVLHERLGDAFRQGLVDEELQRPYRSGNSRSSRAAAARGASGTVHDS
jgi:hypothetical protein